MKDDSEKNEKADIKEFTVVMRAPSAVIFREGQNFLWQSHPTVYGPVNVNYTTRWLKQTESLVVPGHLWIEVKGTGPSLEDIIEPFANAGLAAISIMALTTNASIGESEVEVAFNSTPDIEERDYFQYFMPPETPGILHSSRLINGDSTLSFFNALQISAEENRERLLRATNQYSLALNAWRIGHSTIALAHLWMALEALTVVRLRAEMKARGLKTDDALADSLGIEKCEYRTDRMNKLNATIRKDFILKGDKECYQKAKKASDGFEHGYMGFNEIRDYSKEIRRKMAGYIRQAIFELSGLEDDIKTILLSHPFDRPIKHLPFAKYLRGQLIGKGNKLAQNGNAYPYIRWRSSIKSFEIDEVGNFKVEPEETFALEVAEGITFQQDSLDVVRLE